MFGLARAPACTPTGVSGKRGLRWYDRSLPINNNLRIPGLVS